MMTIPAVLAILQEVLWTTLMICAPLLIATSVVGLLVALLQAVTQLNEPSLNFIPKLVVSGFMLLILGSWMLQTLVNFVGRMIGGQVGT